MCDYVNPENQRTSINTEETACTTTAGPDTVLIAQPETSVRVGAEEAENRHIYTSGNTEGTACATKAAPDTSLVNRPEASAKSIAENTDTVVYPLSHVMVSTRECSIPRLSVLENQTMAGVHSTETNNIPKQTTSAPACPINPPPVYMPILPTGYSRTPHIHSVQGLPTSGSVMHTTIASPLPIIMTAPIPYSTQCTSSSNYQRHISTVATSQLMAPTHKPTIYDNTTHKMSSLHNHILNTDANRPTYSVCDKTPGTYPQTELPQDMPSPWPAKNQSCPVTSISAEVLNNANQWNGAKPKIRKTKKQPEESCDIDAREKLASHRERILKEQERDVQEKSHQTAALKALVTKYENKITTLTEEVKLLRLSAMDNSNDPHKACAHKAAHTPSLRPDAVTDFSKITSCQAHILTPKNHDDSTQNMMLMRLLETVSRLDEKVNSLTNKATAASASTGLGNNHASIPSCCCHTTCMHNNLNKEAPSDNTTHSPNPQQSYSGDNSTHVSNHPQNYSGDNTTHTSNSTTHTPNYHQRYGGDNMTHMSSRPQSNNGGNTTHIPNRPQSYSGDNMTHTTSRPQSNIWNPRYGYNTNHSSWEKSHQNNREYHHTQNQQCDQGQPVGPDTPNQICNSMKNGERRWANHQRDQGYHHGGQSQNCTPGQQTKIDTPPPTYNRKHCGKTWEKNHQRNQGHHQGQNISTDHNTSKQDHQRNQRHHQGQNITTDHNNTSKQDHQHNQGHHQGQNITTDHNNTSKQDHQRNQGHHQGQNITTDHNNTSKQDHQRNQGHHQGQNIITDHNNTSKQVGERSHTIQRDIQEPNIPAASGGSLPRECSIPRLSGVESPPTQATIVNSTAPTNPFLGKDLMPLSRK